MRNNKLIFMALVILVSLLCVSAVSAADDAASDVIADTDTNDVTVLEESIDDVSLADSQSGENVLTDNSSQSVHTFTDLEEKIVNAEKTIELTSDFNNTEDNYNDGNGIIINHDLTINGNGHTIDGNNKGRIFNVQSGAVVTFNDITFVNANPGTWSYGGAISNDGQAKANNCTFIDNKACYGSAVAHVDCENCIFINNSADYYGTMFMGTANNCKFIDNYADAYAAGIDQGTAINSTFINCHLYNGTDHGARRGAAMTNSTAINCSFIGNVALDEGGAIYKSNATNCTFTNNYAKDGGAMYMGNATNCNFTCNNAQWGGAIYKVDATNCLFTGNSANQTGGAMFEGIATNCTFQFNDAAEDKDMHDVTYDIYRIIIPAFSASDLKTYYDYGDKFNFTLEGNQVLNGVNTTVSIYKDGEFVANYTALSGEGWTVDLPVGTYTAELSIPGSNVAPTNRTITVAKNPTKITASAVTATYNVNKNLVITLTDGKGNKLSGVKVTVTLATAKTYTTDKNGQIKINVANLVPKTYTAKISFAGNATSAAVSKNVNVVVKKASPKMTAKAKTFKVNVKTKKYTITLKNNLGKVMKNTKVTLTVNKKTFTVKTNSKGVATFKITNLKKKGKFTATIKYAGSKYYNALSKKVKITIKK